MELSQILERMEQKAKTASAKTEKTASVSTPAETTLKNALNEILKASEGSTKTASVSMTPQEALMKQAEMLVGAEKQAEVEHAKMLGLAFADAAISKWAAYDAQLKHMAAQEEKAAAEGYYSTMKYAQGEEMGAGPAAGPASAPMDYASMPIEQVQALAAQGDPGAIAFLEQVAAAAGQGEPKAAAYMNKVAAIEYEEGQKQALNEIYQTAANEFLKGAAETNVLLQRLAEQQG